MTIAAIIEQLETEWNTDGFFDRVRNGDYDATRGQAVLAILRAIKIGDEKMVPKRLLSLLWYLPSFLAWQTERIAEKGRDRTAYERFVTEILNTLQEVLGVP
ncbi:hypothetical protein G6321_00011810 [Bradyrhizobium barranii subsp. barranii]|uniref:Uncharacterized protein n=1 Tax=Bradyrhizobium barranii subsp. barranii TaxID=2823807 RepID=A0A7Z0TNL5_9BRAD|nr:hypothetical protein [Bradyrhizobium barranii]UGX95778.1 hypothetical protein G6321_00011810 [Bradyrhizobium barranii subsp. barranii]